MNLLACDHFLHSIFFSTCFTLFILRQQWILTHDYWIINLRDFLSFPATWWSLNDTVKSVWDINHLRFGWLLLFVRYRVRTLGYIISLRRWLIWVAFSSYYIIWHMLIIKINWGWLLMLLILIVIDWFSSKTWHSIPSIMSIITRIYLSIDLQSTRYEILNVLQLWFRLFVYVIYIYHIHVYTIFFQLIFL